MSGLPFLDSEIESAANDLDADLCIAGADCGRIADALSRKRYTTLWLAGHGDDDGIWLADNCQIDANTLAPSIRERGIKLIILNSCSSSRMAYELFAKTGATIVFTESEIQDDAGFSTAKRFANELASGTDYYTAFTRSRSKHFRMIPEAPADVDNEKIERMLDAMRSESRADMARLQTQITELRDRQIRTEARQDFEDGVRARRGDATWWRIIVFGFIISIILVVALMGVRDGWFG